MKATIAGLLMLLAAIFSILWLAVAFTGVPVFRELIRSHIIWVVAPLPFFGLAIGFGGNPALANELAVLFIFGIILAFLGGISTFKRKTWRLANVGSVGALVCVPL